MVTTADNPFPSSSVEDSTYPPHRPPTGSGSTLSGGSAGGPGTSAGSASPGVSSGVGTMPGNPRPSTGSDSAGYTGSSGSADAGSRRDWSRDDNDMFSRVVQGAHETIDRLADSAAPHVHRLQDTVSSRADQAREVSDEWAENLRSTVRENPLAAVAAALAVGVLIARLTR